MKTLIAFAGGALLAGTIAYVAMRGNAPGEPEPQPPQPVQAVAPTPASPPTPEPLASPAPVPAPPPAPAEPPAQEKLLAEIRDLLKK